MPKNGELTQSQRNQIVNGLLLRSENLIPKRGAINEVAVLCSVHRNTVKNIWNRAKENSNVPGQPFESKSKKYLCGRKRIDYSPKIKKLKTLPLRQRTTLRSASSAVGVPLTSFFRRLKEGELRRHSNYLKPLLTPKNMEDRINFSKKFLNLNQGTFTDMMDRIHIDEKWFYITEQKSKFYLENDENDPQRSAKSKRFIAKVMFLCAVARPRWDSIKKNFLTVRLAFGRL